MTAEKTMDTNGQNQEQGMAKSASRKSGRRKSRSASAKRGKTAAARRSAASRSQSKSRSASARSGSQSKSGSGAARGASRRASASGSRRSRSGKSAGRSSSGIASRLLSTSRKAAGTAYEWAAEGASRAIPLASRGIPDQRMVQRLADERPYMLGALGLGIGAMIGLMLPSPWYMRSGGSASRSSGRSRR